MKNINRNSKRIMTIAEFTASFKPEKKPLTIEEFYALKPGSPETVKRINKLSADCAGGFMTPSPESQELSRKISDAFSGRHAQRWELSN